MQSDETIQQLKQDIRQEDEQIAKLFFALSDKNRVRIIKVLTHDFDLCVGDLSQIIGSSISSTSQHLKVLEGVGLIEGERKGQTICYRLVHAKDHLKNIIQIITT